MAQVSDITATDWQISADGVGIIAQGMDDVKQCVNIILLTRKGSDPLRPEFGCDMYLYIDKPVNTALPQMIKAMLEAIRQWEPRIEILGITHDFDFGS
jgi:phage baseplate assembly protein W